MYEINNNTYILNNTGIFHCFFIVKYIQNTAKRLFPKEKYFTILPEALSHRKGIKITLP